jgi:formylmethanofuran dehydrogenase subunit B
MAASLARQGPKAAAQLSKQSAAINVAARMLSTSSQQAIFCNLLKQQCDANHRHLRLGHKINALVSSSVFVNFFPDLEPSIRMVAGD